MHARTRGAGAYPELAASTALSPRPRRSISHSVNRRASAARTAAQRLRSAVLPWTRSSGGPAPSTSHPTTVPSGERTRTTRAVADTPDAMPAT